MRQILLFFWLFCFCHAKYLLFYDYFYCCCCYCMSAAVAYTHTNESVGRHAVKRASADAIEHKNYFFILFFFLTSNFSAHWLCVIFLTFFRTHLLHYCARQPPTSVSTKHSSIALSCWLFICYFVLTFRFYYLVVVQTLSRQLHAAVLSFRM